MAIAFTDQPTSGPFHRTTLWHRTAPRELFKAWFSGDDERRWTVWKKHLAQRKRPEPLEFLAGKRPPILWGWPAAWRRDEIARRHEPARPLERRPCGQPRQPRRSAASARDRRGGVRACRSWPRNCRPAHGGAWPRRCIAWPARHSSSASTRTHDPESILRQQLLAGELPLALGYLFPELQPMRSLRQPARQALSEGLIALTDGEGLPHARLLPVLGPLWACWTRCQTIGDTAASRRLVARRRESIPLAAAADDSAGRRRRPLAVRRWRTDEQPTLEADPRRPRSNWSATRATARPRPAAISKSIVPRSLQIRPPRISPMPRSNRPGPCLAVLASGWSPVDAAAGGRLRRRAAPARAARRRTADCSPASGRWKPSATASPSSPIGAWQELCWQSDKKCDFLELGVELAEGLQLERQIVLSKRDNVLLVADVVSAKDRAPHRFAALVQPAARPPRGLAAGNGNARRRARCAASSGPPCCRSGSSNGGAIRAAARS